MLYALCFMLYAYHYGKECNTLSTFNRAAHIGYYIVQHAKNLNYCTCSVNEILFVSCALLWLCNYVWMCSVCRIRHRSIGQYNVGTG